MRQLVRELKGSTCQACGGRFEPQQLHFHHLDPTTKLFNLSHAAGRRHSAKQIVAEARKCLIVCLDCHMGIHHPKPDALLSGGSV